jgi:hypothetical protein
MADFLSSDKAGHVSDKPRRPDGHGHPLKGVVRAVRMNRATLAGIGAALRYAFPLPTEPLQWEAGT